MSDPEAFANVDVDALLTNAKPFVPVERPTAKKRDKEEVCMDLILDEVNEHTDIPHVQRFSRQDVEKYCKLFLGVQLIIGRAVKEDLRKKGKYDGIEAVAKHVHELPAWQAFVEMSRRVMLAIMHYGAAGFFPVLTQSVAGDRALAKVAGK